jgi:hypothetical protein
LDWKVEFSCDRNRTWISQKMIFNDLIWISNWQRQVEVQDFSTILQHLRTFVLPNRKIWFHQCQNPTFPEKWIPIS